MITVLLVDRAQRENVFLNQKGKQRKTQIAFCSNSSRFLFEASFETGFTELILSSFKMQDSRRLQSGVQLQNEAEIAGYILECENLLRQHVVDVQILTDGKYYHADQLVQRYECYLCTPFPLV